uniref:hypothetical protein n=1 Tax=Flavobacterium sp. TaxID=239 RepID=UPI004049A25E
MTKTHLSILLLFISTLSFSQTDTVTYNADGLMRLTIGVHKTNYGQPTVSRANAQTGNIGGFDISDSQGFFINYKVLKYRNHSLKAGLFLNSLRHQLWYDGNITDIWSGDARPESNRQTNPANDKMLSLEYCLDYSYLLKINKKWFVDFSIGLSQERNQSLWRYSYEAYNSDFDLVPYQQTAYSIYFYKRRFYRTNYAVAVGYRTDVGMFNLGVKYSLAREEVAYGQYEFFEPGTNEQDQGFGFFSFSGDYISATLSFTPSKYIFKKKK